MMMMMMMMMMMVMMVIMVMAMTTRGRMLTRRAATQVCQGPTRKPKLGSVNFSNPCSASVANWKAKDLTFVFVPNRLAPV